jgi:hypothetical protein
LCQTFGTRKPIGIIMSIRWWSCVKKKAGTSSFPEFPKRRNACRLFRSVAGHSFLPRNPIFCFFGSGPLVTRDGGQALLSCESRDQGWGESKAKIDVRKHRGARLRDEGKDAKGRHTKRKAGVYCSIQV